jgi:hypothetical protein
MRIAIKWAILSLMSVSTDLSAASPKIKKAERSPLLAAVTQCRSLTEPASRLACFDKSVAAFDLAEASQAVIVIDERQVRETRRSLFGISLPDTGLLSNSDDLPQIETTLKSASVDDAGRWTFQLSDGARWIQTDDYTIARRPRENDNVVIKRGMLGSFKLSVGGQPSIKAKRQN